MRRAPGYFVRWLCFNAVGAAGLGVQLSVLAWLRAGVGLNYLWATTLAVEAAVLHNFLWHEKLTWRDRASGDRMARLVKFNLTNGAISILGNLMVMRFLVGTLGLSYLPANLLAITVCSLANFYVGDRLVFVSALGPHQSR
jgi:putative flippase GtrA